MSHYHHRLTPLNEIDGRYPNLVRHIQWTASLSRYEARLVLWATKNHIEQPVGGTRVSLFGTPQRLVLTAIRTRNS